jgi:hypothetical protein
MLAEVEGGNQTMVQAAELTAVFWEKVLLRFSPQEGCIDDDIQFTMSSDNCLGTTGVHFDCATWSAGGFSVLADVTKNTTMQQM